MRNKFLAKIVGAATAFAVAIGVGAAIISSETATKLNAAEATYTFKDNYNSNTVLDGTAITIASGITATFNKRNGGTATQYYTNGYAVRWYGGGTLAIDGGTSTLTSIEITYTQTANPVSTNVGTYELSDGVGSWSGSATSITFTQSGTTGHCRISDISVTYSTGGVTTYTVSYNANGGEGTMTDPDSPYNESATVTVMDNGFTRSGYAFNHWDTKADDSGDDYDEGDTFTINSNVTLYAQWDRALGDLTGETGTINFGSGDGSLNVNGASKSAEDDLGVKWTVTTDGTDSFTPNAAYAQIGSGSKPASSITFETASLGNTYKVTSFSAKFGGFNGTAGDVTLKVGDTTVGTGSLNAGNDVTITNSSVARGSTLSVAVDDISKGVKVYFISYTLASATDEQTITASAESVYTDQTITLTTNADSAAWSITENTAVGSLSANNGKSTVVSATQAGSVTVQAVADWFTTVSKTVTFTERPASPYITPTKNSTSGYTGQNETLSFTYGNTTSLNVVSSNTSVVTVEEPSCENGNGTVQINFAGVGSTTVKFNDGSSELASVSVSVAASTVTITGLPENRTIFVDGELDLSSTITVNNVGSYSANVDWESDDSSIADVDSNGVVTGVAAGSATITVSSHDYPSASMQCVVKVLTYGTPENPLNITQAKEVLDQTQANNSAQPLTVRGTVSSSTYSTQFSNYTIWLQSDDGETPQAFELYAAVFDVEIFQDTSSYETADALVGYEVVVTGYGKIFNTTYELTKVDQNYPTIKSLTPPAPVPATSVTLNTTAETLVIGDDLQLTATLLPVNGVGDVTWLSSDSSIADVDSNGLVTAVAAGSATITAHVSELVEAECAITVLNPVASMQGTLFTANLTGSQPSVTTGYSIENENAAKGSGAYYQDKGDADVDLNYFVVEDSSPLFAFRPAFIKLTAYLGAGSARDPLGHNVEACFVDDQGDEIESTKVTVADALPKDPEYFTVSIPYSADAYGVKLMHMKEDKWNVRYYSFSLSYSYAETYATLLGSETEEGGNISVDSVAMRFSAKISVAAWNSMNTSIGTITNYGIMMFKSKSQATAYSSDDTPVQDRFEEGKRVTDFSRDSGEAPSPDGDYYIFSANVTYADDSKYGTVVCAAPYVVIDGTYYFLGEMQYSVNTLAQYHLANGGSSLSDGALTVLAGN